jgi:hypothetical protein
MHWVLGVLAVAAVAGAAMALVLGAIRRTARRQQAGLPPLPSWDAPAQPLLEAAAARYLGTTYAPSPVRRFSGLGLLGRDVVDRRSTAAACGSAAGAPAPGACRPPPSAASR